MAITRGILSYRNWIAEGAVISGDSAETAQPAANLAVASAYEEVWQTRDTVASGFTASFGVLRQIDMLALVGCLQFAAGDTVRHRLSAVAAGADDVWDSGVIAAGVVPGYDGHIALPPAASQARFWRCDIVAPSQAPYGYFRIGYAWAGPDMWPARNHSLGADDDWDDPSDIVRAPYAGRDYANTKPMERVINLTFGALDDAERQAFAAMRLFCGARRPVLIATDRTAASLQSDFLIGRLRGGGRRLTRDSARRWSCALSIAQML